VLPEATRASLRVFDLDGLVLRMEVSLPRAGSLAAYDPATDQLYFLDDGQLWRTAAGAIRPPAPADLPPEQPPSLPVTSLAVPASWRQEGQLFAVWGNGQPPGRCYAFAQFGGFLYRGSTVSPQWTPPRTGLPPGCPYVSALAVSPDFERDGTLWAGIVGSGLYRTADGGRLWQPASDRLPSMSVNQIALSPGFAADRTIFLRAQGVLLLRSTDGGTTWQKLSTTDSYLARHLALSPEFSHDHTLALLASLPDGQTQVRISRDGGDHWQTVANPGPEPVLSLSLAPEFARWGVLFAYSNTGRLYRSADAGQTWQPVLATGLPDATAGQWVYGASEERRPVFFLATAREPDGAPGAITGRLFRSPDGGLTWQEVSVGGTSAPTALAISPDFAQDGVILVGTAQGQIKAVPGLELPAK
jgi:photosystem II stability/assembly factor-like uncharacterized protein